MFGMRTMRLLAGTRWRGVRLLLIFVALLAVVSLALAAVVYGHAHSTSDDFSVTDCSQYGDPGTAGTLAAALSGASGISGATIAFDCATGGTIIVPATITITNSINFTAGSTTAILSGGGQVGVFDLSGNITVTFTGLTIADGLTTSGNADGSAILNDGATLTLTNMTLSGNVGRGRYSNGGAIFNHGGTLNIIASTFNDNTVQGTFVGLGGAMINIGGGTIHIANSTFSGNSASGAVNGGWGGVFYNADFQSTITVVNSTFAGNTAETSGAASYINNGSATFTNTLLANSQSGPSCGGVHPIDGGYNLEDTDSCGFSAASHDLVNVADPKLGALGGYGGPTATIPLNPGSPAINAANLADCPAVDQRGTSRPQGQSCDIGAFELPLPATLLGVGSPSYVAGPGKPAYITGQTTLTLTGVDAGHGVGSISYCLFPQGQTCTFTTSTQIPLVLTIDGSGSTYELDYFANDSAGDAGRSQRVVLNVDNSPPSSALAVTGGPITPSDPLTVTATDAGSGVQGVAYRCYAQGDTPPAYTVVSGAKATFTVNGPKGTYVVEWYAVDHLGNTEAAHSRTVIVVTPPSPSPTPSPTPTATTPPPSPTTTPTPNGGQTANISSTATATTSPTATSAPAATPSPTVTHLPPPAPPAQASSPPPLALLLLVVLLAVLVMLVGALVLVRRSRRML